jgi:hypothetical protein
MSVRSEDEIKAEIKRLFDERSKLSQNDISYWRITSGIEYLQWTLI